MNDNYNMYESMYDVTNDAVHTMEHRLLLCAPSNGAVDELVERLVAVGVYDRNGKCIKPRTIRIGRPPPSASDAVKSVTLQNRVAAALKVHPLRIEADDCARAIDKLQQQLNTINKQLDNPTTTSSTGSSTTATTGSSSTNKSTETATATSTKAGGSATSAVMSSRELLLERKRVTIELGVKRRRRREAYAALDAERKRVRNNILDNAQVSRNDTHIKL
jgi:AAA domain